MKIWIIVPAAGIGKRFSRKMSKQYERFLDVTVLEFTLMRLLKIDHIKIVVTVSANDKVWKKLDIFKKSSIEVIAGGEERADSVRLALEHIKEKAEKNDWVLIHDGVRPCVRVSDILSLISQLSSDQVGGILAAPVIGTLKRVTSKGCVSLTEDRSNLWEAQTPQMFRFTLLYQALKHAETIGWKPTDESAAMERIGCSPRVIEGRQDNIKITRQEDIVVAEAIVLSQQEEV